VQQYYRGKAEAYWDIAHGNYKGQRCINACIALKPTQEYERRILKYANVRIESNADCGYRMRGYNEVQWARVDRLYPGAYESAISEAIQWDRRRLQNVKE
jgi:hypothetical protein